MKFAPKLPDAFGTERKLWTCNIKRLHELGIPKRQTGVSAGFLKTAPAAWSEYSLWEWSLKDLELERVTDIHAAHPILDNLKIGDDETLRYRTLAECIQRFLVDYPEDFYGQKFADNERDYKHLKNTDKRTWRRMLDSLAPIFQRKDARLKWAFGPVILKTPAKCAEANWQASTPATPSHQLVNMPATNDERAFEHLAKYFAGFFAALGILQ
jgi:hypothetical protein